MLLSVIHVDFKLIEELNPLLVNVNRYTHLLVILSVMLVLHPVELVPPKMTQIVYLVKKVII